MCTNFEKTWVYSNKLFSSLPTVRTFFPLALMEHALVPDELDALFNATAERQ